MNKTGFKYTSIPSMFLHTTAVSPSSPLFGWKENNAWKTTTYIEAMRLVMDAACALKSMGLSKGNRVLFYAKSSYEWAIMDLAVMSLGAVSVLLHHEESEIIYDKVKKHVSPKLILSTPSSGGKLQISEISGTSYGFEEVIQKGQKTTARDFFFESIENITSKDLCSIIYTSGSTGFPKGVMLTHGNILSNLHDLSKIISIRNTDTFLSFLPLSHALERTCSLYGAIMAGASIFFTSPATVVKALKEISPTIIITVPRFNKKIAEMIKTGVKRRGKIFYSIFNKAIFASEKNYKDRLAFKIASLLIFPKIKNTFCKKLRILVSGGAPLPYNTAKLLEACDIPILPGYGLTEASPVVSVNIPGKVDIATVGQPLSSIEIKTGENNELLVRGPNVMAGYYKNPEATAAAIDDKGWLHTGDAAEIDSKGHIKIIGRIKDTIVLSSGEKINPSLIEALIEESEYVNHCCVVGEGRNFAVCLITGDKDKGEQIAAHISKVNENLARHEKIRRFTFINEPFSVENGLITSTMKIKRESVETRYRELIEKIYSSPHSEEIFKI